MKILSRQLTEHSYTQKIFSNVKFSSNVIINYLEIDLAVIDSHSSYWIPSNNNRFSSPREQYQFIRFCCYFLVFQDRGSFYLLLLHYGSQES
jgi:hypothetical protein